MALRKNVIRVGDYVKIINPELVLRCGYPLTKKIVKDTIITAEQKDSIHGVLKSFGVIPLPDILDFDNALSNSDYENSYDKILDILAYEVLKKKGYGGKEKRLRTIKRPSLQDKFRYVIERKVVKTGDYNNGYRHNYFGGHDDYEPPYLSNEKTHVLFLIYVSTVTQEGICPNINEQYVDLCYGSLNCGIHGVWIEKNNLEKGK
jgi:hypothetical protein